MLIRGLLALLIILNGLDAAKIGIFTAAFSNSQIVFNIRVAESLAADGHDVVLIRPEYNPQATSLKSKNPKIREIHVKAASPEAFAKWGEMSHREIFEGLSWSEWIDLSNSYKGLVQNACSAMLSNDEFIEEIRKENIDLAFHHHIDFCQHGIAHHVGIRKWVQMYPGPTHSLILRDLGIPYFDSYMPNLLANATTNMSFLDRVKTITGNFLFVVLGPLQVDNPMTEILRKKFGRDFPHVSELRKTAILSFVNNDPFLEYPYPYTQKIQFIGGLGTQTPKALKKPFASIAEKAKKIVLVSFGSVVVAKDMPENWKQSLLELFRNNPEITFFWKFEEEIEVPKNVVRTNWLPQNDLLALNKTIAFITHGGYNSLGETVQSGTPCVFVPLIADQYRNSALAHYRGIGVQMSKKDFDFQTLNSNLHLIMTENKYLSNVRKYQSLTKGRLNSPDQILRHWTKLALTHHLDMSLPQLNLFQLYNLDVYLLFSSIIFVSLFVLRTLFRWYYWSCCEMAYKEKEKIQ